MTYFYANSKIAAGYNQSGSLQSWEAIKPTNDIYFIAPVVFGSGSFGQERVNTDGTLYYAGYASAAPVFGYITQDQVYYIYHTINSDKLWGKATVEMRFIDPNTYHIYNTILKLEQLPTQSKKSRAYERFKLTYTRLVLLS